MRDNNEHFSVKIWGIEITSNKPGPYTVIILVTVLVFILAFSAITYLLLGNGGAITIVTAMIGFKPASSLVKAIKGKKKIDP